jgi:hypothetical protein
MAAYEFVPEVEEVEDLVGLVYYVLFAVVGAIALAYAF